MLERREHELDAFEELCAGERDNAEVEEDAEEHRKRDNSEQKLGEQAKTDGNVHEQVGQALLFHFAQLRLIARYWRARVDGQAFPVRQCTNRIGAHP